MHLVERDTIEKIRMVTAVPIDGERLLVFEALPPGGTALDVKRAEGRRARARRPSAFVICPECDGESCRRCAYSGRVWQSTSGVEPLLVWPALPPEPSEPPTVHFADTVAETEAAGAGDSAPVGGAPSEAGSAPVGTAGAGEAAGGEPPLHAANSAEAAAVYAELIAAALYASTYQGGDTDVDTDDEEPPLPRGPHVMHEAAKVANAVLVAKDQAIKDREALKASVARTAREVDRADDAERKAIRSLDTAEERHQQAVEAHTQAVESEEPRNQQMADEVAAKETAAAEALAPLAAAEATLKKTKAKGPKQDAEKKVKELKLAMESAKSDFKKAVAAMERAAEDGAKAVVTTAEAAELAAEELADAKEKAARAKEGAVKAAAEAKATEEAWKALLEREAREAAEKAAADAKLEAEAEAEDDEEGVVGAQAPFDAAAEIPPASGDGPTPLQAKFDAVADDPPNGAGPTPAPLNITDPDGDTVASHQLEA